MGILLAKERVLDTIITQIGKEQLANGKLRAEYVSFSDLGAIYKLDTIVSGGLDQTYRLCFEATSLPQDLIVFEADDSGKLLTTYRSGSTTLHVIAGQIISGSNKNDRVSVSGSQFASLAEKILDSSLDNFQKQYILASPDPIDERYDQFIISSNSANFTITEERPINDDSLKEINVDHVESFFLDKRLSHLPNFKYLPPINKPRLGEAIGSPLGFYANLNQEAMLSYDDVAKEISSYENLGYSQEITFLETSRANNLLCQFFEIDNREVLKLDVIDFGKFPPDNNGVVRHVFFIGKVFIDSTGSATFCNLFTLIFEN